MEEEVVVMGQQQQQQQRNPLKTHPCRMLLLRLHHNRQHLLLFPPYQPTLSPLCLPLQATPPLTPPPPPQAALQSQVWTARQRFCSRTHARTEVRRVMLQQLQLQLQLLLRRPHSPPLLHVIL